MENIEEYFELVRQGIILKLGEWCKEPHGGCYCTINDENRIKAGWVKINESNIYLQSIDNSYARIISKDKVFPDQK